MNSREAFERWADDYALFIEPLTNGSRHRDCQAAWNAALSAAKRGVEIDGEQWQLVPVEPTQRMSEAGTNYGALDSTFKADRVFEGMLTAAKEQQT